MDFNDVGILTKTSSWAQALAVIFVFLGGCTQATKWAVDARLNRRKAEISSQTQGILKGTIDAQAALIDTQGEKLRELEKKTADRHLTSEQTKKIENFALEFLPKNRLIAFTTAASNHEAQVYASEIIGALRRGGCVADLLIPTPSLQPSVNGVIIAISPSLSGLPQDAQLIANLLSSLGVPFERSHLEPDFFPNTPFVIAIGAKPIPQ